MASKAISFLGLALAAALLLTASPRLVGLLANTALLAAATLAVALVPGVLLAIYLAKTDLPGRRLTAWLCVGWLFVPLYVQAAAWNAVAGPGGWVPQALSGEGYAWPWLAGWRAAIWVHAMAAVPWMALLTAASLTAVERRLEEESLLDATPLRVLVRVSLRRGCGGLGAASLWIAVVCATEIAVTDLFQVRTFAEEIYTQAALGPLSVGPQGWLAADLVVGVSLIALLAAVALRMMARWLPIAAAIPVDASWRWRPERRRRLLTLLVAAVVAIAVVPPTAALAWKAGVTVLRDGDNYQRGWSLAKAALMVARSPWEHRREWGWSLAIGTIVAATATAIGVAAAWFVRLRPRAAAPLAALIALGLAAPAPLAAVAVIAAMNQSAEAPLSFLTVLYDRTLAAPVIVQLVRVLPLACLWFWSQLASVPQDLLEAARSEGASGVAQLVRIALPLRWPGVATGVLLALVLAMGEVSATLLVTPPGVTPISVRIFQLIHYGVDDRVAALALSIFAALAAAIALAAFAHRRWAGLTASPPPTAPSPER